MLSNLHAVLVLATTLLSTATSKYTVHDATFQPDYVLRITEEVIPVACVTRSTTLVNGTSPGPPIYLRENQTTWIRVYNDMETRNTTMHWHGLSQATAPFSDGTPQASQWPIKGGEFFDYEIRPPIGEAGTYFYHSHVGFQAVSVAGALIVEEVAGTAPPYTYDEERIILFTELFNKTDTMTEQELLLPASKARWPGDPETILMNGNSFSGYDVNYTQTPLPWTTTDQSLVTSCGPEIIQVEPGKTYRLRLVGSLAQSILTIGVEDHAEVSIMAADARYTKLAPTDHIQIASGQRFDVLLHTKTEEELRSLGKTDFWIQMETRYRPMNVTSYAVLSYTSDLGYNQTTDLTPPEKHPLVLTNDIYKWLEYTLEPVEPNGFPSADTVNREVYLYSYQIIMPEGVFQTVSNRTWTENDENQDDGLFWTRQIDSETPYLVDIFKRGEAAIPDFDNAVQNYGGWDPVLNAFPAKVGETIDIILVNQPNGLDIGFDPHPWHIHGGHIYDLGSGPGAYNATANEERLKGFNPAMRDSTILYKYTADEYVGENKNFTDQGWRAWRLVVEDPGVWMVHCHILQHMIMGMQTVWVMGNASEIVGANIDGVDEGYLEFGGDAYGNSTYDPLVRHYFPEND